MFFCMEPIEVRVERKMIEIVSFPGTDHSVTKEGLKQMMITVILSQDYLCMKHF